MSNEDGEGVREAEKNAFGRAECSRSTPTYLARVEVVDLGTFTNFCSFVLSST